MCNIPDIKMIDISSKLFHGGSNGFQLPSNSSYKACFIYHYGVPNARYGYVNINKNGMCIQFIIYIRCETPLTYLGTDAMCPNKSDIKFESWLLIQVQHFDKIICMQFS